MRDRPFDATDARIRSALSDLVHEMPTLGKAEGWERIERRLYSGAPRPMGLTRWRFVLSVTAAALLILGLLRMSQVAAWDRRAVEGLRGHDGSAQTAGSSPELTSDLDRLAILPFAVLMPPPDSQDWVLLRTAVDLREGTMGMVALQYRDSAGGLFTLREDPVIDPPGDAIFYHANDPGLFTLKVRNVNVTFLVREAGFLSASWIEDGLRIELWGSGGVQAAVRLIESLIPYRAPGLQ